MMSTEKKAKAIKKEAKSKKPARAKVEPTETNLKAAREAAAVTDYSLPKIRKSLSCTWGEAVAIRHALLKAEKK
jgi:hypothetical protein